MRCRLTQLRSPKVGADKVLSRKVVSFSDARIIGEKKSSPWSKNREVLGIAPTGHSIHSLELIAFHKLGLGVNVVFVNEEGMAY